MSEKRNEKKAEIVYDPTNERIVIGAALADRKERDRLTRQIAADELLVPEHSACWRALRTMTDKALEYEFEIFARLATDEMPTIAISYLEGLDAAKNVPANLGWYVSTLRWDATRARVVGGPIPELVREISDPKSSPDAVASAARSVLRAVEGGAGRSYICRPDELQRSYLAEVTARKASGNFWSFGLGDPYDRMLVEGAMPKRTAVVAGLPGVGKSTYMGAKAIALARLGRRVLYCCWEMPPDSMLDVMIAGMLDIELERIVQGNLTEEEMHRMAGATKWITKRIKFMGNPFHVRGGPESKGKRSNDRSLDILEGYIAESGCDVVIMDLWERCLVDLSYEGVTTALYRQQAMHADYNVYGVIVHQLRLKDVEKRADKRPTREAIKGTGAFVEVADQIFGLHRDAQFKMVPDDSLEVINMKQRKGRANWAVRFEWDGEHASIRNPVEIPYDPGLESSTEFGDISDVKVNKRQPKGARSRREA